MTSPLITRLHAELGFPLLESGTFDDFIASNEIVCLFFTEDPAKFPETLDLAVVLPELAKHFAGQFEAAVVGRNIERALQQQYDVKTWPALVFLRDGQYLGCISKIQDWAVYMQEIPALLKAAPKRNPGIGIAVKIETRTAP